MEITEKIDRLHKIAAMNGDGLHSYYVAVRSKPPPSNLSLDALDSYAYAPELGRFLLNISPEHIVEELGEDVLIWVWANHPHLSQNKFLDKIHGATGMRPRLLAKSLNAEYERRRRQDRRRIRTSNILLAYKIFEKLDRWDLDGINLQKILKTRAKEGIPLSDHRMSHYRLHPMMAEDELAEGFEQTWGRVWIDEIRKNHVYLDAPFGIALMYDWDPQAVFSFDFEDHDMLMVRQIQGVQKPVGFDGMRRQLIKAGSRRLYPLEWELAGLDIVSRFTEPFGFQRIGVLGARNNPNVYKPGYMEYDVAVKRYERTARRAGLIRGDDGNFYGSLALFRAAVPAYA